MPSYLTQDERNQEAELKSLHIREKYLDVWLLQNDAFHPDYDARINELNGVQTKMEIIKKRGHYHPEVAQTYSLFTFKN